MFQRLRHRDVDLGDVVRDGSLGLRRERAWVRSGAVLALIAGDEDDREPEDEREREDREENEATGHAARGRPLGVVAGGQDDPAPVATNEVDR